MEKTTSPSLIRRLAAALYDILLVLPLIMFAVALATGLQLAISSAPTGQDFQDSLHPQLVQLIALLTTATFFSCFWLLKGQTLGMQAWRIRLCSFDGAPLTISQCLLRCAGALISLLPAGAGYLWCLVDRKGRYWHDYWSKTELELLPKRTD
jgi:uncharacterized RDD family membrane protein YckC